MTKKRKIKTKKHTNQKYENVYSIPETFIEDTFDLVSQKSNETIIDNKVKIKKKKLISRDELILLPSFTTKLAMIKQKVEFNKSFNFLLDFTEASKLYRTYFIDDDIDELDILLHETVLHFKKRLARIKLSYKIYLEINDYFDNLQTLYNKFKNAEMVESNKLAETLLDMKDREELIKYYLF